jgi:hypothetical protein
MASAETQRNIARTAELSSSAGEAAARYGSDYVNEIIRWVSILSNTSGRQ